MTRQTLSQLRHWAEDEVAEMDAYLEELKHTDIEAYNHFVLNSNKELADLKEMQSIFNSCQTIEEKINTGIMIREDEYLRYMNIIPWFELPVQEKLWPISPSLMKVVLLNSEKLFVHEPAMCLICFERIAIKEKYRSSDGFSVHEFCLATRENE